MFAAAVARHPKLRAVALAAAVLCLPLASAGAEDADEADPLRYYEKVGVWSFAVDYDVGHNNQDLVAPRELAPLPPPAGKLRYIRFDLMQAVGDFSYGFKPGAPIGLDHAPAWAGRSGEAFPHPEAPA